jgi:hypothetical protein
VVGALGYAGAEVAHFLKMTISPLTRLAVLEELPEVRKYPNLL